MSIIRYGFYGEDEAQRLFLHHYLAALRTEQPCLFEADEAFAQRYRATNKKQVDNLFAEVCEIGLSLYQQQCFFVGRDLDDFQPAALAAKLTEMQQQLSWRNSPAVLLVPVQCIEHWLWHLHWHHENPALTKNHSLETKPRKDAKIALYGTPNPSIRHSSPIVERIASDMDIDWLCSRSPSFGAFHRQVQAFLADVGVTLS